MKLTSSTIEELVVTLGLCNNLKPACSRLDTVAAHLSPRWTVTPVALVTLELRTVMAPSESVSHRITATLSGVHSELSSSEARATAGNTQAADSSAATAAVIILVMSSSSCFAVQKASNAWTDQEVLRGVSGLDLNPNTDRIHFVSITLRSLPLLALQSSSSSPRFDGMHTGSRVPLAAFCCSAVRSLRAVVAFTVRTHQGCEEACEIERQTDCNQQRGLTRVRRGEESAPLSNP